MNLAQLQALMLETVTRAGPADSRLAALIRPARGIPPEDRLDAYRTNVRGAHLNALHDAYPVAREVLGERYWQQLLVQEIPAFGSAAADLHQYGGFVPELLAHAQQTHAELAEFGYLHELAQLEWALHRTLAMAEEPAFDWAAFQTLDPARRASLRFVLSGTLREMHFVHPVDALWHAHRGSAEPLPPQSPVACCVHRQGAFEASVTRLSECDRQLLKALRTQTPCEALPAEDPQALLQTLHDWIGRGWIAGFRTEPDSS